MLHCLRYGVLDRHPSVFKIERMHRDAKLLEGLLLGRVRGIGRVLETREHLHAFVGCQHSTGAVCASPQPLANIIEHFNGVFDGHPIVTLATVNQPSYDFAGSSPASPTIGFLYI